MTIPIIFLVVLYLAFSLVFYYRSLVLVLESLLALVAGFVVSVLYFDQILAFVSAFGLEESVYTPSLVFILVVILVWAICFTVINLLFNVGHIIKSYKTRYLSFIISIIFTLLIGSIACLTVTPFLQSAQTQEDIENCFLCSFINSKSINIGSLDGNLSKVSLDVYMPGNEQKAIKLSSEFEVATHNPTKSRQAVDMVNNNRSKALESVLEWDGELSNLAIQYGNEISQTKYFAHTSESGIDGKQRAEALGLKFNYLGENLAIGPTLERAHNALVESESHYKNIISPVFTKVGIAVFDLDNGYIMLIQEFAS